MKFSFLLKIYIALFLFWGIGAGDLSLPFIVNASESEQEKSATVSLTIYRPIEAPQVLEVIPFEQEKLFRVKVLSRPSVQLQLSGLPNGEEKQYQTNSEGVAWVEVEANDSLKEVELVAYDGDDGKSPVVKIPLSFAKEVVDEADQPQASSYGSTVSDAVSFRFVQFFGLVLILSIVIYGIASPRKVARERHKSLRHFHHKSRK